MIASIGVIAYNEENNLPRLLEDLHAQTYEHKLTEIILVDSNSTDSTKKIMEAFYNKYKEEYYSVQILDNPKKIQAVGWNVAIANFRGDTLTRIDAHSHIPEDFMEKNVKNIFKGEYVSGGKRPCINENDSLWEKTLLQVENSLFGSGINKSRHSDTKQYVKTMFHATYRREVLDKVGYFNEKLLRTEDNEFHYRIKEAGYQLFYDPEIVSYQYCRSSLQKMIKQKFGNGYWIAITLKCCPKCLSLFYFVPVTFLLAIIVTTMMAVAGFWQLSAFMWSLYILFIGLNMYMAIKEEGYCKFQLLMPVTFLILHISYGIGTLVGLLRVPFETV